MGFGLPYVDIDEGHENLPPPMFALKGRRLRRAIEELEFNDELVRAAFVQEAETWLRDTQCPWLALRLRCSGARTFYLLLDSEKPLYPDADGQEAHRKFLGSIDDMSVAQARTYAELLRKEIVIVSPKPKLRRGLKIAELFSKFEIENPSECSDWSSRRNELLRSHLLPMFGDAVISGVRKNKWTLLAQKVAFDQKSRGEHLLKALKFFLRWAVERGALEANPLARQRLLLPSPKPLYHFDVTELAAIYEGATQLKAPWDAIFGLTLLTGMPFEEVSQIHSSDIAWGARVWRVGSHEDAWGQSNRHIHLSQFSLELLEPYRSAKGYLFVSRRSRNAPINLHASVFSELRSRTDISKSWGLRDCRRALRRQLGSAYPNRVTLERWADQLLSARAKLKQERETESASVVL